MELVNLYISMKLIATMIISYTPLKHAYALPAAISKSIASIIHMDVLNETSGGSHTAIVDSFSNSYFT